MGDKKHYTIIAHPVKGGWAAEVEGLEDSTTGGGSEKELIINAFDKIEELTGEEGFSISLKFEK